MEEKEISIRRVNINDFDKLTELSEKCFPGDEVPLIIKSLIDIEHFYVIENHLLDKIIGFVIFGIFSIKTAHLMILAVHPEYQRKGYGSALLEKTIETVKLSPIKLIRLEVKTTNLPAIKFYEKYGFKIATTIKNYYEDNSDAFLMLKQI
ncbi:MAG TPA: ribosomal protein S18-alanine N-acetyltransferase [Candidatus Bathyarchaeia archaeon]|nr:ribosomal protein S18-alanine N-acetyltransferase [Candidatus Bathyarchaeia archaeon]